MNEPDLGMIVTAKAGRDRGKRFIIVGCFDETHVLIADGNTRTIARPKKKKVMHVRVETARAENIRQKLVEGIVVQDAEIRKAIAICTLKQ